MRAYIYDDIPGDQRLAHDNGNAVSLEKLAALGVTYQTIQIDEGGAWEQTIDAFAKERGYKNVGVGGGSVSDGGPLGAVFWVVNTSRDQINVTPAGLGEAYESKIRQFFDEHLHDDEEVRFIVGGSGFFDIRAGAGDADRKWIRIAMEKGDLIVLPAGIYHRFTVDEGNTITAMRLFQDEPKWTPYSRAEPETDAHESRSEYLSTIA